MALSNGLEIKAYEWYDGLDEGEKERLTCQWIRKYYENDILPYKEEER